MNEEPMPVDLVAELVDNADEEPLTDEFCELTYLISQLHEEVTLLRKRVEALERGC